MPKPSSPPEVAQGHGNHSDPHMMPSSPDLSSLIRISIALRRQLRAEIKRTGINSRRLIDSASAVPDGVTATTINRWMSGIVKEARQSDIDFVLKLFAMQRDDAGRQTEKGQHVPRPGRRWPREGEEWISVTEEMARDLRREFVRTDHRFHSILNGASDVPDGLTPRMIYGWEHRETKTTNVLYWRYVLARLAAMPTVNDVEKW